MFNWPKFHLSSWNFNKVVSVQCIQTVLGDSMLFIDRVTAEKPMIVTQEGKHIFSLFF